MSAGVEDGVHHVLVADGALVAPRGRAGREGGGLGVAGERRAGGRTCGEKKKTDIGCVSLRGG